MRDHEHGYYYYEVVENLEMDFWDRDYIWILFSLVLDGDESIYDYNIWGVYGKLYQFLFLFFIECDLIVLIDIVVLDYVMILVKSTLHVYTFLTFHFKFSLTYSTLSLQFSIWLLFSLGYIS
jgi:hypothetical protein